MLQSDIMSENLWSIYKFNLTESFDPPRGFALCGGVLLTEIFGVSVAHCMFEDSHDAMFKSLAGKHDLSQTEVNEQSWVLFTDSQHFTSMVYLYIFY